MKRIFSLLLVSIIFLSTSPLSVTSFASHNNSSDLIKVQKAAQVALEKNNNTKQLNQITVQKNKTLIEAPEFYQYISEKNMRN